MSNLENVRVQVVPHPDQVGNLSASNLRERFTDRITELTDVVRDLAKELRERLASGLEPSQHNGWGLDTVEMEFSLELEATAGVVIARASTSGGFTITLGFSRTITEQGIGPTQ